MIKILHHQGDLPRTVWNHFMRCDYHVWPVGQECAVHCHQGAGEVFVFLEGQCEITVNGESTVVGPGYTVYVGPGDVHKLKAVGDRSLVMFSVVAPNHPPTHTIHEPDGTIRHASRSAPSPDAKVIWG